MNVFDDVYLVNKQLEPVQEAENQELELKLGITLPDGYKQFMTRFGEGIYCYFFRIYPPEIILRQYEEVREWWAESFYTDKEGNKRWLFEESDDTMNPEQLQESFIIGDSIDGDQIVYYPPTPEYIYILPRQSYTIAQLKSDFSDLHHWDEDIPLFKSFESWVTKREVRKYAIQEMTISNEALLDTFKLRWQTIVEFYDKSGEVFWDFFFHIPEIYGAVWISRDKGEIRTYSQDGVRHTIKGKKFEITIKFDADFISEVDDFIRSLQEKNLIQLES